MGGYPATGCQHDRQREALRQQIHAAVQPRQILYAAVKLGIADVLRSEPRHAADLAQTVGADPSALRRLLRGLVTLDVLVEDDAGRFGLTLTGELLCRGVPGSVRGEAIVRAETDRAWAELLPAIRTGGPAFYRVFGQGIFEHYAADPDASDYLQRRLVADAQAPVADVVAAYPFPVTGTIMEVGGGYGALLTAILHRYPGLRGVLFDLHHVVDGARGALAAAGLAGRCEMIAGDFFAAIPGGADVFVLYRVVHDWDDDAAACILVNCHQAMGASAKLLLVEKIMPERAMQAPGVVRLDLDMLVQTGGRQRTEGEYRALLARCGFQLTRSLATRTETSVLEAVPQP